MTPKLRAQMWEEFKTLLVEYEDLREQESILQGRRRYLELSLSRMSPYVRQLPMPGWFRQATEAEVAEVVDHD